MVVDIDEASAVESCDKVIPLWVIQIGQLDYPVVIDRFG